jgi:hypothetical protein
MSIEGMEEKFHIAKETCFTSPETSDNRDYPNTRVREKETEPRVYDMGQLLSEANIISEDATRNDPPTNSEEVPNPSKQQRSDDQDDIVRVCFNFNSNREVDINVKIKGEFAVSLL